MDRQPERAREGDPGANGDSGKEDGEFADLSQMPLKNTQEHRPPIQEPIRKRCDSLPAAEDGDQNESKVLVIYTGGTIGMIRNADNSKYIGTLVIRLFEFLIKTNIKLV